MQTVWFGGPASWAARGPLGGGTKRLGTPLPCTGAAQRKIQISKHSKKSCRNQTNVLECRGDQPPPRPEVKKREITVDGVTMTLNQWAEHAGITPAAIHTRLGIGWTERQAVGVDPRPGADKSERAAARREKAEAERRNRRVRYGGFEGSRKEAAQRFGIAYATLSARLNKGWSVERALTAPVGHAESQRERRERLGLPPLRFS